MPRIKRTDYSRPRATLAASPFRYPGGKAFLTDLIEQRLGALSKKIETYVEAFAGGAGAAMNLLRRGAVERIVLNDLDIRVYSAWRAILHENSRFLDELRTVSVDLTSWHRYRAIVDAPTDEYSFELGFATYFINRTSRAGIVSGSGPIGGYQQDGAWKIDARFYRETMLRRCIWIGENAGRILIQHEPALSFLRKCSASLSPENCFYFIDPPYVAAGSRLYFDGMSIADHMSLAHFLLSNNLRHWMLTYDNNELVRKLYRTRNPTLLEVGYSLRHTRKENELLVSPT